MKVTSTHTATEIEAHAFETFDIETERRDDELGSLVVKMTTDDAEIVVEIGRFYDDAIAMKDTFLAAAKEIEDTILKGWEDVPDEFDAYVHDDRDGYYVSIEGVMWDADREETVSQTRGGQHVRPLPSREIAEYELARAMSKSGCFPNAWYTDERGWSDNIAERVRAFHDEGGTGLLPLEGVRFEEDSAIRTPDGWRAYVVRDYGNLGMIYVLSGDDTRHFAEGDERDTFVAIDDDEEEDA